MIAEHSTLPVADLPLVGHQTNPDGVDRTQTNGHCIGGAGGLRNPRMASGAQRLSRSPVPLDGAELSIGGKANGNGEGHEERPTHSAEEITGDIEFPQSAEHRAFDHEQDRLDMMRLVAGRDEALEGLMQRHVKRLLSQLMRILRNNAEAQECLLEAFVRVYQHRHDFHLEAKFSTWLYVIAFNLARDRLRRQTCRPEFVSLEAPDEEEAEDLAEILLDSRRQPDQAMEDREWSEALAEAVASLPELLRQPLVLFAEENKSQPEIAAQMQCTVKAVEMRLYHARKCLQRVLEEEFRENEGFGFRRRSSS